MPNLKSICLFIPSLHSGGAERVLTELANYFSHKGHKITLVTLDDPKNIPFYALNDSINLVQLDLIQEGANCFQKMFYLVRRVKRLRSFVKNLNSDFMISFLDIMNIFVLLSSVLTKIPVVIAERTSPAHHKIPKIYQFLRWALYPFALKLVVQTQSAANFFSKCLQSKIIIVPNAVRKPSETIQEISQDVKNIISVGRLSFEKDHKTLIHAFALLLKDKPNLKLTIYGEGRERKKMEQLIEKLGMKDYIFLPGAVSNIQSIFVKADLFVFASLYEGFPNALCEAMAIGLPVIASNCSGNIDIIDDDKNGILFPVGNVEKLYVQMLELINNCSKRQEISHNAKHLTALYSEESVYEKWNDIING